MYRDSQSANIKNVKQFLLWVAFGLVCILTLIPLVALYNGNETKRIVSMNIIVEAKYEDVYYRANAYHPIYIYKDENHIYSGYGPGYSTYELAETRIGDTIQIYIDGEGKSVHATGYRDRSAMYIALSITGGVIALGILTIQIVMIDRWKTSKEK